MQTSRDQTSTQFIGKGGCVCGSVQYTTNGAPLFRAFCHCETCQAYNQADYADILVMRSGSVALEPETSIDFQFHQWPPVVSRGKCADCGGVAVEKISLPLFPKLIVIPAQTLRSQERAPAPAFHMFCHRRVSEIEDNLPRHSGYLSSQWAFTSAVLRGLR